MKSYSNSHLEEAMQIYSQMIIKIACQYVRNKQDAEDIMQEVFIKFITCNKIFDEQEHLKAWLIRVTINMCKNHLKSSWTKKRVSLTNDMYTFNNSEVAIMEELFLLPPKHRIILYLYYYEEYNLKEISLILNKNINTIGSQLQRARKKLKFIIDEKN
jgi:RNA polymerase sigma-70 factor (ECF subfamily)